jgi:hypothetical protein
MEKLIVLLVAIALIILGARGTYKALWNSFFPNEPIVTTPVSTGANVPKGAAQQQNQSPSGYATNPNELEQQAAKATQKWISTVTGSQQGTQQAIPTQAATGPTKILPNGQTYTPGGSVYPVQSVPIQPTYTGYVSNAPSWWPSWLPWAFGG